MSIHAHEGALEVQITASGAAISGLSRVPVRITIKSGRPSEALKTGVPHVGQKLRTIRLPLSAMLRYSLN
ncbi:MAG: hypothetical protein RSE11_17135 [Bosea sp. (in: a-proteobacteria)]|nr:hypothetical protein [Bosea sp. (in: a-proteobacteria)]WRH56750.1 MAG: hypothetical protein RSE11_17135 [Bosea sp. (in: a-proteobacteria)]